MEQLIITERTMKYPQVSVSLVITPFNLVCGCQYLKANSCFHLMTLKMKLQFTLIHCLI